MMKLITQAEIQKFHDQKRVNFPKGTIITPSACDWANEHGVEVIIEGENNKGGKNKRLEDSAKVEFLNQIIAAAAKQMDKNGISSDKKQLTEIVTASLKKMDCLKY